MTAVAPLAHIRGIRAALIECAIRLDELGNRTYAVSALHRPQAAAIQAQANQLAVLLMRAMEPTAQERAVLKDFFDVRQVSFSSHAEAHADNEDTGS